jgi:hypothetical protein
MFDLNLSWLGSSKGNTCAVLLDVNFISSGPSTKKYCIPPARKILKKIRNASSFLFFGARGAFGALEQSFNRFLVVEIQSAIRSLVYPDAFLGPGLETVQTVLGHEDGTRKLRNVPISRHYFKKITQYDDNDEGAYQQYGLNHVFSNHILFFAARIRKIIMLR